MKGLINVTRDAINFFIVQVRFFSIHPEGLPVIYHAVRLSSLKRVRANASGFWIKNFDQTSDSMRYAIRCFSFSDLKFVNTIFFRDDPSCRHGRFSVEHSHRYGLEGQTRKIFIKHPFHLKHPFTLMFVFSYSSLLPIRLHSNIPTERRFRTFRSFALVSFLQQNEE